MGTPSTNITGATCLHIALQNHLSVANIEEFGVNTATEFFVIKWSGDATTNDCRGCTDGTVSVPGYRSSHPYFSSLEATRIEIRPVENNSRRIFQMRVEYSDDETTPANPLDTAPDIQWDIGEDGQVPYFLDFDPAVTGGKPCVNKAGERFADFLQRYSGTVTATFSVNIPLTGSYTGTGPARPSWDPATVITYCTPTPAVNSDAFTFDGKSIAIGTARAKGCSCGSVQIQNGVKYRVKKWSLAFKSSWNDVVDNRGFNETATVAGKTVLKEIIKGTPPVKPESPWPLKADGTAYPNVTDVPPQITFKPYPQKVFSSLGFI